MKIRLQVNRSVITAIRFLLRKEKYHRNNEHRIIRTDELASELTYY